MAVARRRTTLCRPCCAPGSTSSGSATNTSQGISRKPGCDPRAARFLDATATERSNDTRTCRDTSIYDREEVSVVHIPTPRWRGWCVGAVCCVALCVLPAVALAGSSYYCDPCSLPVGIAYQQDYETTINNTQIWNYAAGNYYTDCTGVYSTSRRAFVTYSCYDTGSYSTATCSVANGCEIAPLAGHPGLWNMSSAPEEFNAWFSWV